MTDYAHIHQPVLLEQCVGLVAPALRTPGALAVATARLDSPATASRSSKPPHRRA